MHTRLSKTRVEKDDFAAYQRFHDDVAKAYRFWLTLRPTHDVADAAALETLVAKAPARELYSTKVLARLYLDNDRRGDASRILASAVKHHPDEQTLWEMRLQAAVEPADKEKLYRAMIAQFPSEGQYVVALGSNLVQRGELADAKKVLLPLAENTSPSVRGAAHYQLARIDDRQGQLKDALTHLTTAVDSDVALLTDVKVVDFKARVHARLGEVKEAIATYRLALDIDEKAHELLYPLVKLEWQAGQKADALDHLRRYTVAVGNERAGLIRAAELHLLLGRSDDALELAGASRRTASPRRRTACSDWRILHARNTPGPSPISTVPVTTPRFSWAWLTRILRLAMCTLPGGRSPRAKPREMMEPAYLLASAILWLGSSFCRVRSRLRR